MKFDMKSCLPIETRYIVEETDEDVIFDTRLIGQWSEEGSKEKI